METKRAKARVPRSDYTKVYLLFNRQEVIDEQASKNKLFLCLFIESKKEVL